MPTYNRRLLVERAIRSVLAQTRRVDEVIVIDDGSTDGTAEALQALFGEQIRYVWQENRGVSSARNHGLRIARGRYLTLLDSDDEWLPDKTRLQWLWLESNPAVKYAGKVTQLDKLARPRTRGVPVQYFGVTVSLEKTDMAVMKPGSRVRVVLEVENIARLRHRQGEVHSFFA